MKIKQLDMRQLIILRQVVAQISHELKEKKGHLEKLEADLLARIDAKAPVQRGTLFLLIQESPGQIRPRWKDEFAARLGAHAVDAVIESTVPKTVRRLTLLEKGEEIT